MTDQDFERKETARLDAMFDAQFANEPTQEIDYSDEPQVNGWLLYSGLPDKTNAALRMADGLEFFDGINLKPAAAELRRLHKLNAERKWLNLTDEEIGNIIEASEITLKNYCSDDKQTEYARAIEAALKAKNA